MALIDVIKDGLKIVGSIIPGAGIVSDVINAIDGASPEQKAQLNDKLLVHEVRMKELAIQEYKETNAEAIAEIQSDDKFTKRSRPFGVYCASIITSGIATALCFGVQIDTTVIGTLLLPLWGNAGFYTYNRSKEKMNK